MEIMQQETRLSVRVLSSWSYPQYPEVLCWQCVSFKETWRVSKGFIVLEIKVYRFLVWKPEVKGAFGKPKYRGEVNSKEIRWNEIDCLHLFQGMISYVDPRFLCQAWKFTSWTTVSFLKDSKTGWRGSQKNDLSRTCLTGLRIAISLSRQMKSHSRMFHHAYGDSESNPRLSSSRHSAARNTSNRLSTPSWWSLRRAAQWVSSPWRYTQEKTTLTEHPGWVLAKCVTSSQHLSHGEKEEKISTWIALLENIETRRCLKC